MNKNALSYALAATLSLAALAGCQTPGMTGASGVPQNTSQSSAQSPSLISQTQMLPLNDPTSTVTQAPVSAQASVSDEQDVEAYNDVADAVANGASQYSVAAISLTAGATANAAGAGSADASATGTANVAAKIKAKLADLKKLRDKIEKQIAARRATIRAKRLQRLNQNEQNAVRNALSKAKWTDNGDGTETKTVTVNVTRTDSADGTFTRSFTVTRTIEVDTKVLVSGTTDLKDTFPPGGTNTVHWNKTLNSDGSYSVVYSADRKWANGIDRSADWNKIIDASGNVSGTGTLTWTDKNGKVTFTETLTFGGSDLAETAGASAATGTVPPSPSPVASATPAPSASPSPSPAASPSASPSPVASADAAATTEVTASAS